MEKAAALIDQYVPPSPERIQKAKDAGNMEVRPQPDGKVRVEFTELRSALGPARHRRGREGGSLSQRSALRLISRNRRTR